MKKIKQIELRFSGSGHYKLSIIYRGKQYSATTTNMHAVDRYKGWYSDNEPDDRYTRRQAEAMLWNEVKRANNLR